MSAISNVGSSTASQYADQLRRQGGPSSADFAARMQSVFASAAKAAGVSDSDIPGLMQQVKKAVEAAKSDGSKDPGSVRTAIEGVLKNNGVDVAKFNAAVEAQRPKGGPGGPGGAHKHHHKKPSGTEASSGTEAALQSDSTQQTELQKLIATLQSGNEQDAQTILQTIKQQSTGNGTLFDAAA